jgi:hypothetical protein
MSGFKELASAIVIQAVDDWRYLCEGNKPTRDCNFNELDRFFKGGCNGYIDGELAERIYAKLKMERRVAELSGKIQKRCP